jgi:hypothetical protein
MTRVLFFFLHFHRFWISASSSSRRSVWRQTHKKRNNLSNSKLHDQSGKKVRNPVTVGLFCTDACDSTSKLMNTHVQWIYLPWVGWTTEAGRFCDHSRQTDFPSNGYRRKAGEASFWLLTYIYCWDIKWVELYLHGKIHHMFLDTGVMLRFSHSWSWALLGKPPIVQLFKIFSEFYETREWSYFYLNIVHFWFKWNIPCISYFSGSSHGE